jgi:hypothetical protein
MRKIISLPVLLVGTLLLAGSGPLTAQNPPPVSSQFTVQSQTDLKTLNALIGEVQAQQAAIAANQVQIDQKIAALAETIRTARLFSKRGK